MCYNDGMVNEKRLTDTFIELTTIDAESGDEAAMREYLTLALADRKSTRLNSSHNA